MTRLASLSTAKKVAVFSLLAATLGVVIQLVSVLTFHRFPRFFSFS